MQHIHFALVTYPAFPIQLSFTVSAVNMAAPLTTSAGEEQIAVVGRLKGVRAAVMQGKLLASYIVQ
jgi:hypothetical protein